MKKYTTDIIFLLIVSAGVLSFFYNPMHENMEYLRLLMAGIVGFFTKGFVDTKTIPVLSKYRGK